MNNRSPIDENSRRWIEHNMSWFINQFGADTFHNLPTLLPAAEHFPFPFDGTQKTAFNGLTLLCDRMNVNSEDINLEFYTDQLFKLNLDSVYPIYANTAQNEVHSTGLYFGKDEGKYTIALENGLLSHPFKLIATLSHELGHIKLLGEARLIENDEYVTDLLTVFFGTGIFNANASYLEEKTAYSFAWSRSGYFSQQEWGYALAIYAYMREDDNPDWIKHLTLNIQSDFKKSFRYISDNPDKIFQERLDENFTDEA